MGVGKVYLVGAGPGAPDLISLRGYRLLHNAHVVIIDRLLPSTFLESAGIPQDGKIIRWLGSEKTRIKQTDINQLMLSAAQAGKNVARLKTGDPFIFGRGGEEVEFLAKHGIPVEVVPGISSALAAPAEARLPLTHRDESRSFAVVTARCAGGGVNDCYPSADNLVVLMGASSLREVVKQLRAVAFTPATPAAVIERASLPWERRLFSSLGEITEAAIAANISAPTVLVVGPAAARQPFHSSRPLVLFTGLDPSNFRTLGDILHWPALQVVRNEAGYQMLPQVIEGLRQHVFDWIIFTSRIGVDSFFSALAGLGCDSRLLAATRVAASGEGTAANLAEYGVRPDAVPMFGGSRGILEMLVHIKNVLLIQGSHAPQNLEERLRERNAIVMRLSLHNVIPHNELGRPLPEHDAIYFVSPSGVRAYYHTYGAAAFEKEVWCIGETTRAEIIRLGGKAKVVDPHVS